VLGLSIRVRAGSCLALSCLVSIRAGARVIGLGLWLGLELEDERVRVRGIRLGGLR
jgi:hypothetical protein